MTQKIKISGTGIPARMFRKGLLPIVASLAAVLCIMTSCIYDSVADETDIETASIGISVRLQSTGTTSDSENVDGSVYENYIDIAGGDYRIYFFTNSATDGNDICIAQFFPTEFRESGSGTYKTYSMTGQVPNALLDIKDFKIMVLANWGTDNYPTLGSTSTIDDVCSWGVFSHKTDFELSEDNLIPMYGIHEYTGVTFTAGETTALSTDEPINLLRAMAKIEVVLTDTDLELASVVLQNYNDKGYCAPSNVYKNSDYATYSTTDGWVYISDGLDLHLVGDANDSDQEDHKLNFSVTTNDDGNIVWYCYAPEYANTVTTDGTTTTADDYAYIQLNPTGLDKDMAIYRLYFRNYSNGSASAGADYDIGRNVIYRFTVSMTNGILNVHVDEWEDSYENDFTFSIE